MIFKAATLFLLSMKLTPILALLRVSSLSNHQTLTNGEKNSSCLSSHDNGSFCDVKIQSSSRKQNQNHHFETSNYTSDLIRHDETTAAAVSDKSITDPNYSKIRKGEIYVHHNFLDPSQVALLRKDISQLQQLNPTETKMIPAFKPSGLSNRVAGDRNNFGSSDRLTCTITPDLLRGDEKLSNMRLVLEEKMETLKLELQEALSPKPKLFSHRCAIVDAATDEDENRSDCRLPVLTVDTRESLEIDHKSSVKLGFAEMYYSISPKGSHLPRHQDERHEETKGMKGWINDSRRRISWLIYLNDDGWGGKSAQMDLINKTGVHDDENHDVSATARLTRATNQIDQSVGHGGELRAYIRKCCPDVGISCGSYEGDIQVGWLRVKSSPSTSTSASTKTGDSIEYEPIFLDSWVKTRAPKSQAPYSIHDEGEEEEDLYDDSLEWQAMSALYRIRREEFSPETEYKPKLYVHDDPQKPQREYLSQSFGPNSPSWPSDQNLEPADFARALASQLTSEDHRNRFVGVEDTHPDEVSRDSNKKYDSPMLEVVDVVPTGGTLVLFDSVTVPHEVLEVTKGTRLAVAGWFHEPQQEFPKWYGT